MVKAIHSWKTISKRPTGRPKTRWEDDVKKGIQKLKVPNWKTFVQDRRRWKEVVEKAKTLHQELYSRTKKKKELKVSTLTALVFDKMIVHRFTINLFVVWKFKGMDLHSHWHDDSMQLSSRLGSNRRRIVFCVDSDAGIDPKIENSCLPRTTNSWHSCESCGAMTCVISSRTKRH